MSHSPTPSSEETVSTCEYLSPRQRLSPSVISKKFLLNYGGVMEDLERSISLFDLDAIKSQAAATLGKSCNGCYTISQGGFNTVFILTFEDGTDIIARVSGSIHKQDRNTDDEVLIQRKVSEVATMRFVKRHTTIPVPKVFYVDAAVNGKNPVRAAFMLMERIQGPTLFEVWFFLSQDDRERIFTQILDFQAQLLGIEFDAIGSLVEAPGGNEFVVGPLGEGCSMRLSLRNNRGPFKTSHAYIMAHVDEELDLVMNRPSEWKRRHDEWIEATNSVDDISLAYATKWLQLYSEGIRGLPLEDLESSEYPFVLYHEDLDMSNVVVSPEDPSLIIGILDWEGSRVLPIWDAFRLRRFMTSCYFPDAPEIQEWTAIQTEVYDSIQPNTGYSRFNLVALLQIIDGMQSTQITKKSWGNWFLGWYERRCIRGQSAEITSFYKLKQFIESEGDVEGPV